MQQGSFQDDSYKKIMTTDDSSIALKSQSLKARGIRAVNCDSVYFKGT
jgi:hypothetical protein